MTLHTYDDVEQRSERWYELRRGIVTASTVGKFLTPTLKVADNDTSRGTAATLAAERITGVVEDTPITADMWRGIDMEPHARDAYSKHRAEVVECGFMRLERDNFTLGYSPDGLVGDIGLIEVKCPRAKGHIATILTDEVPAYYMAQLQAGLLVSGRAWVDYVSFHSGLPLYVKRVHTDQAWHDAITFAVKAAEFAIDDIVSEYHDCAEGLPTTERIDPNIVELKLA